MWQNKFASPLDLEPAPSRYLLLYLLILHSLAAVALLLPSQIPFSIQTGLLLIVVASLVLRIYRYRAGHDIHIIWRADDSWDYESGGKRVAGLYLLPDSYVTRWLIILHFKKTGMRRITVVLMPDSLPADIWHLLRIRLLYSASASAEVSVTR